MLCLVALMPLQVCAYDINGISGNDTWREEYVAYLYDNDNRYESLPGSGTMENPYLISSVMDLCRLVDQVDGGYAGNEGGNNFKDKFFRLEDDLDLGGHIWYPIGVKKTACFAGYFDGNGHTIKNMTITIGDYDEQEAAFAYGLFGYMKGVIRNLKMTGATITLGSTASNQTTSLRAGLLCGFVGYDLQKSLYGAIWGCDISGEITGTVRNAQQNYANTFVGGMVGRIENPASIYQCHANVTLTVANSTYVGGIVGCTDTSISNHDVHSEGDTSNSESRPKASYLFDCAADVTMTLTSDAQVHGGGICGANKGCSLVACASSGSIVCQTAADGSQIGGIAGYNEQTLMNCVSLANITSSYTVGGIIGKNIYPRTSVNALVNAYTVVNCVYSGHIDCGTSTAAHGIVGSLETGDYKPVNCLFLGTMTSSTLTPLWNNSASNSKSYCDQNLYDNWQNRPEYLAFSQLTSGNQEVTSFKGSSPLYVDWEKRVNLENKTINYDISSDWQYQAGFYPRLQMTEKNITYNDNEAVYGHENDDLVMMYDFVIRRATYDAYYDEDEDVLHRPKHFPAYAWLASVPAALNDGLSAQHLDATLSLADKQQEMEQQGDVTIIKTAHFAFSPTEPLLVISGQTATPKVNVSGEAMLTITSTDNLSKQLCMNVYGYRSWDGKIARNYDGGTGTDANPYLIHNARQLIKAFAHNSSGKYYKLVNDIWFNENLLTNTGEPKDGCSEWDHKAKRDSLNWRAHLDGDGHFVRGLFSKNAFGLIEKIHNGASIQNTGFVDCLVWSPTTDTATGYSAPCGFFAPVIGATAAISNCLFDGVVKERRSNAIEQGLCGFIHTIDNSEQQIGENPIVEDCVVSVVSKTDIANLVPEHAFLAFKSGQYSSNISARRVLVLNNSMATSKLTPPGIELEHCHYGKGYLPLYQWDQEDAANSRLVTDMTNGTFFTGNGFNKWKALQGRFPMLKTFAETAYGKLISLPVYTDMDNRLDNMNYLLDFTPGNATWQVTSNDVIAVDTDIRVLEPKTASSSVYLVRSLEGAKVITPITTAASIEAGIKFSDEEAKKFCLAHYDANGDDAITLSELKNVTLDQLQQDMNEDDGNAFDNDGALIEHFPEFRYFAGIDDLGTSFHDKDKLQTIGLSGKITELSANDFRGNASMSSFNIPTSVSSVSGQAFIQSGLQNYEVETDHAVFDTVEGMLTNRDKDQLLSYPCGRQHTSITLPSTVTSIASDAIYKLPKVDTVFISTHDYTTVVDRTENSIVHATEGKQMVYYIEDATNDDVLNTNDARSYQARRRSSETGEGNGHLVGLYKASDKWQNKNIKRYFTLNVSDKSKDDQDRYWATMYIGFDVQLPEGLTPYTVQKKDGDSQTTLVLTKLQDRKVPMLTPVVIMAEKSGEYKLLCSEESKYDEIPMYDNILEGVKRDSMQVNQSDSNDGGCLTLGKNKSGKVGFFIYKGTDKIPAYRAYITVNTVNNAHSLLLETDNEATGVANVSHNDNVNQSYYDLKGQRREQPSKGVNIAGGRKFIKK